MKWLSIIFSLITVMSLLNSINENDEIISSASNALRVPESINPIMELPELEVEKDWLAYLKEPVEAPKTEKVENEVKPKPIKSPFPTLMIGDQSYQLLGIFKQNKTPFILLKGANTDLVKLQKGDELSEGVSLLDITSSAITISQGAKTINFKLFELSGNNNENG